MALVDTRATPDSPEQREARDDSICLGEAGREAFWEELAPRLFAPGTDPALVEAARALALEQPITALVTAQETIRTASTRARRCRPSTRRCSWSSGQDRLTPPSDSEAMVAVLPNARFSRIADAGHLAPLERPEVVAGLLVDFLEEVLR